MKDSLDIFNISFRIIFISYTIYEFFISFFLIDIDFRIAIKKNVINSKWEQIIRCFTLVALIVLLFVPSRASKKVTTNITLDEMTTEELKKELFELADLHKGLIISDEEYLNKKAIIEKMLEEKEQFRKVEGRDKLYSVSPVIQELLEDRLHNKDEKLELLKEYLRDKRITIEDYDYALEIIREEV